MSFISLQIESPWLMAGDCLEKMTSIPDGSVDMVLADLPYGTTTCKWDAIIPLSPLWENYDRITKKDAVIALTSAQPFTSALVMSNPKMFRFEWVWDKRRAGNFFAVKNEPLRVHENIMIFSKGRPLYSPQMEKGDCYTRVPAKKETTGWAYGKATREATVNAGERYPRSIIPIGSRNNGKVHPTQKPVALFEYLIRTYTRPGEVVLDNCFGSGTTGVACVNTGRRFIGIEKHEPYFEIGQNRINTAIAMVASAQTPLFDMDDH